MITRLSKQSDVLEALEKLIGHCSLNFSALISFKEGTGLVFCISSEAFCFIFCNVG